MKPDLNQIRDVISQALAEDIGSGDVTSESTISADQILEGRLISKADGIVAGLQVVRETYKILNPDIEIHFSVEDGGSVQKGTEIARIQGQGRALLSGERVALNFLQRMSGIATQTRQLVEQIKHTKAKVLDTRKTVPGLRRFDKWAVQLGGGMNHRFGLFDMVMIKDNHISAAGGILQAVEMVRRMDKQHRAIEVEVKNLQELEEVIELNVDRVLLDNMNVEMMQQAVSITKGRVPLEASGNINLNTIKEIAETGVDFISVGSVTHSVEALDISFLVE